MKIFILLIWSILIIPTQAVRAQSSNKIEHQGKTLEETVQDYILSFPKHKKFSGSSFNCQWR